MHFGVLTGKSEVILIKNSFPITFPLLIYTAINYRDVSQITDHRHRQNVNCAVYREHVEEVQSYIQIEIEIIKVDNSLW